MTRPITIESTIHFRRRGTRKEVRRGAEPEASPRPTGRVPRISRFMALAIRFEQLIRAGQIADYAELARLGHVTRARITQIMNLRLLAPDIQEELLFLPIIATGRDKIHETILRPVTAEVCWSRQRAMWKAVGRNVR